MQFSFSSTILPTLGFALAALSSVAHADYVWLERDANGAPHAYVGELAADKQPPASVTAPRAYLADGKDLPVSAVEQALVVDTSAAGDVRLVTSRVGEKGVLNYYQARYGRSETKAVNDLELVPTEPNGNTFKLVWKGNTVAASQVNVETSAGWSRVLKPAADGTVTLPTQFPGLYLLEVTARVNGSVTVDGKKYDDVRHTATLTFDVKN
ncbi:hypothetical protein GCM10007205_22320 [Oxalicibacterium flavum]|uniref:DUF4198 domain-containing protein n=1 Tax=Oxalicibacterium flavum TaxID=179467 RepID=A0A8J2ULT8_9BURK|nr:hypothetical protein [Oxalicibacterium flavum]GGC12931.1 hypothetical protein GCM10007205_22320 [Oxalicibacterium flavum]